MNYDSSIAQAQERHIAREIDPEYMPRKRHHHDIVGNLAPRGGFIAR
jgi:hypothetical protein